MTNQLFLRCVVFIFLTAVVSAHAQTEIQSEFLPVIEATKSENDSIRVEAVKEILAIRTAVAGHLVQECQHTSDSPGDLGSKASGLFLAGTLGIPEAFSILKQNADWTWSPPEPVPGTRREVLKTGPVGAQALQRAGFQDVPIFTTNPVSNQISLDNYPKLQSAIDALDSQDRATRRHAEDAILEWYNMLSESFASILSGQFATLYPQPVKVSAALILGELRAPQTRVLVQNAGMMDQTSPTASFNESMSLASHASAYPCVDALLKLGKRIDVDAAYEVMFDEKTKHGLMPLADEDRQRVVQALALVTPEKAAQVFSKWRNFFRDSTPEKMTQWGETDESRSKKVTALNNALVTLQSASSNTNN